MSKQIFFKKNHNTNIILKTAFYLIYYCSSSKNKKSHIIIWPSHIQIIHNLLNSFFIDWYLDCFQAFALINSVMKNAVYTSRICGIFSGSISRSGNVVSKDMNNLHFDAYL